MRVTFSALQKQNRFWFLHHPAFFYRDLNQYSVDSAKHCTNQSGPLLIHLVSLGEGRFEEC